MKKEVRILGVDDSPFDKFGDKMALVIGVFFRGGSSLDGVMTTEVTVDGTDSTGNIAEMVQKSKFFPQIRCIMLNGIAVAGLNVIDIQKLSTLTGIPVIVVMRAAPLSGKLKLTLKKLGMADRAEIVENAGDAVKAGNLYVQFTGCDLEMVSELLRVSCTRSNIPEPIRVAHLMAAGIRLGESKGRA